MKGKTLHPIHASSWEVKCILTALIKSDKYVKSTAISAIKRSTSSVSRLKYSTIYEGSQAMPRSAIKSIFHLEDQEELICSTIITDSIWTILTTRKIITKDGRKVFIHAISGLSKQALDGFKEYSEHEFIKGTLEFKDGDIIPFFVEGGNSSMVMVYAIKTIIKS